MTDIEKSSVLNMITLLTVAAGGQLTVTPEDKERAANSVLTRVTNDGVTVLTTTKKVGETSDA